MAPTTCNGDSSATARRNSAPLDSLMVFSLSMFHESCHPYCKERATLGEGKKPFKIKENGKIAKKLLQRFCFISRFKLKH
jgi:hypothetical protein